MAIAADFPEKRSGAALFLGSGGNYGSAEEQCADHDSIAPAGWHGVKAVGASSQIDRLRLSKTRRGRAANSILRMEQLTPAGCDWIRSLSTWERGGSTRPSSGVAMSLSNRTKLAKHCGSGKLRRLILMPLRLLLSVPLRLWIPIPARYLPA